MQSSKRSDEIMKQLAVKYGYSGLFHTPESTKEIQDWIDLHSPAEQAHLYTVLGMTMNLYSGLIAEMICGEIEE